MADIFLPTLHTFAMENSFTGSSGMLRFRVTPKVVKASQKEVDFAQSSLVAEFWHGLFCYEKSTVESARTFPMSDAGLAEMKQWLEDNI